MKKMNAKENEAQVVYIMSEIYSEWMKAIWLKTGGVIAPSIAAQMLGVSMTRINQLWKEKNLERFEHPLLNTKALLRFSDVIEILEQRKKNNSLTAKDEETGYHITIQTNKAIRPSLVNNSEELKKAKMIAEDMIEFIEGEIQRNKEK